jgi:hypothetical protein
VNIIIEEIRIVADERVGSFFIFVHVVLVFDLDLCGKIQNTVVSTISADHEYSPQYPDSPTQVFRQIRF